MGTGRDANAGAFEPGLSLLFRRGCRPSLADIRSLAEQTAGDQSPKGFAFGHEPSEVEGWVELVVNGLSFDLVGLSPAAPAAPPPWRHGFGFDATELPADLEAVRIIPAPHIIAGAASSPVVRTITALAAVLTRIGNVRAVCWNPAGIFVETQLFVRLIGTWLAGGAFPSLGLTALVLEEDGGVRSDGLAFFIGQEFRIEPIFGESPKEVAKLAVRLIHRLIEEGRLDSVMELPGPDGSPLKVEPSLNGSLLRVWRRP